MNNNYTSSNSSFAIIFIFLVMMYIKNNTYNESYIHNMSSQMDMDCVYKMEEFYKDKGYTLSWVGRYKNSSKEYSAAKQKWALPFLARERYDVFRRDNCSFIMETKDSAIPKEVFYTSDEANDILRNEEPETTYYR